MDYFSLSSSASYSFIIAISFTLLGFVIAFFSARLSLGNPKSSNFCGIGGSCIVGKEQNRSFDRNSSCNGMLLSGEKAASLANGSAVPMHEKGPAAAVERQTGASMMEQLVPEITTHALSYLDYPSLCRLSMTNSLMRKAANDDNAWKALYHKDFTMEQSTVKPPNGWKAYYAATRAVVDINAQFFNIVRERSLQAMSRFWLNSDYVKCIHASGELFTGYTDVMQSWQIAFNWEQPQNYSIQILDVRTRVLSDMAWVTMKAFVDPDGGPYNMTNIFEHHNERWYMVHHHSSVLLADGEDQQMMHA